MPDPFEIARTMLCAELREVASRMSRGELALEEVRSYAKGVQCSFDAVIDALTPPVYDCTAAVEEALERREKIAGRTLAQIRAGKDRASTPG